MKRLVVLCFLVFSFVYSGVSQEVTSGSLLVLKGQGRVNMEVDFSHASIHGFSEDAFADFEHDWIKDKNEVIALFIGEVMANCDKIVVGMFDDTEYTIKVDVLSVTPKGDYYCKAELINKSDDILATIDGIKEYGGKFGSKLNLIKDGAIHTGAAFGRFLRKKLKK